MECEPLKIITSKSKAGTWSREHAEIYLENKLLNIVVKLQYRTGFSYWMHAEDSISLQRISVNVIAQRNAVVNLTADYNMFTIQANYRW